MMKLLPPGYDLRKLPPEVIKAVMNGQLPDLSLLPMDVLQHLKDNFNTLPGMANVEMAKEVNFDKVY